MTAFAAAVRVTPVACIAVLAVAGCGGGGSPDAHAPAPAPLTITSSLDGRKTLPHRIHWTATPGVRADKVGQVEFLIDGKSLFVEKEMPYTWDEDGGWLVTSWIPAGEHTFGVRLTTTDGKTATDDVKAEVVAPPEPPAPLAGKWTRDVTDTSDAPPPGSAGNPTDTYTPKGTYTLSFDEVQAQTRFPGRFAKPASDDTGRGWILDADYSAGAHTLSARGGVTKAELDESMAEGGWWCTNAGPEAAYEWSVKGDTLTLEPTGEDACAIRGFIWAGKWQRK